MKRVKSPSMRRRSTPPKGWLPLSGSIAFALALTPAGVRGATVSWDGNGDATASGLWGVGSNWSTNTAPTSADVVVLGNVTSGNRTVTLASGTSQTITQLNITQTTAGSVNTLNLDGNLTIAGTVTPFAFTVGSGVTQAGIVTNLGAGVTLQATQTVATSSTVFGGTLNLGAGSAFRVQTTGSTSDFGAMTFSGPVNATGTGADMAFSAGRFLFQNGLSFDGAVGVSGINSSLTIRHAGGLNLGTVNFRGNDGLGNSLNLGEGTQFTLPTYSSSMNFTNRVTLAGTGVGAAARMSLGMAGSAAANTANFNGGLVIGSGGNFTLTGTATAANLAGTSTFAPGSQVVMSTLGTQSSGIFANSGNLTMDAATVTIDWAAPSNNTGGARKFSNTGTWTLKNNSSFVVTTSTGRSFGFGQATDNFNSGTINLQSGSSLEFLTFGSTGTLNLGSSTGGVSDATVDLGSPLNTHTSVSLTNGASASGLTTGAATLNVLGNAYLGRTTDTNATTTLTNTTAGSMVNIGNGTSPVTLTIANRAVSIVNGAGTDFNVNSGGTLLLKSVATGTQSGSTTFSNSGTLTQAGKIQWQSNTATGTRTLTVGGSGIFKISGTGAVMESLEDNAGVATFTEPQVIVNVSGRLSGNSANDLLTYTNSTGAGSAIRATMAVNLNGGELTPGNGSNGSGLSSVGNLGFVDANVTLNSTARLKMDIGGADAGQFDTLTLSRSGGTGALFTPGGGSLVPQLVNGYIPDSAAVFTVVSASGGIMGAGSSVFGNSVISNTTDGGFTRITLADGLASFAINYDDVGSVIQLGLYLADNYWTGATDTNWSNADNWLAFAPGAAGQIAKFTGLPSAGALAVNLDGNQTIGGIQFDSTASNYTISSGASALTLSNLGSAAVISSVGSHNLNVPLALGAELTVTTPGSGDTISIGGNISGTGRGVTKTGNGTLLLAGVNTYTGNTTISQGTLRMTTGGAIPNGAGSGNVILDGGLSGAGTLDLNGVNTAINGLSGLTGTVTGQVVNDLSATNVTLTVGAGDATATFAGTIRDHSSGTGTVSLTKTGTGVQTLSGVNTYTGTTTFTDGTLSVDTIADGGVASNLGQASNAAANLVFDGGTLQYTGVSAATDRNFTINNAKTAVIDVTTSTLTLSGASAATSGGFTKTGNGTLILSGVNAYTGTTTVDAGTLSVSGAGTLGNSADLALTGGLLDLAGTNQTVGAVSISVAPASGNTIESGNLTGSSYSASLTSGTATVTANLLANGSAGLTKTGAGTLVLSGTNTYSGITTLSAGTVSVATIGNGGVAGNFGQAGNAAANLVFDGGTLLYTGATASTDRNFMINNGKTAVFNVSTNNLTLAGAATASSGSLTKSGNGTLTLSGVNFYTGTTTVTAGNLTVSGGGTLGDGAALTLAGGLLNLGGTSQTVGAVSITAAPASGNTIQSGNLTGTSYAASNASGNATVTANLLANGSAGLTKSGAGTLILSGVNTYTGTTAINAGNLTLSGAGTLGSGADLTLGGGLLNLGNTSQTVGAVSITAAPASGNTIQSGNLTGTSYAASLTTGNATVTANLRANGSAGLSKTGAGTLILSGTNTYTGITTLSDGILSVATIGNGGVAGNFGQASNDAANLVFDGGTLLYTGATASTDRNFTINNGAAAVFSVITNTLTLSGVSGATTGGFTKAGNGTLTLTGVNAYTGITSVNAGTLTISGAGTLGNGADLTLGGGLLDLGGTSQTVGAVTITAAPASGNTIQNGNLRGTSYAASNASGNATVTANLLANGSAGLTKSAAGTLILSGVNTYTGTTSVDGGTLTISGAGTLGNAAALSFGGGLLDLGGTSQTVGAVSITAAPASGNTIQNGNLTGSSYAASNTSGNAIVSARLLANGGAGLTMTGAGGTLTLSAANTYTGTTAVSAGTLTISGAGTLGNATALTLGGGLLDLGGTSQTVGAVTITAAPASGNTIQNGNLTGTSYAASNSSGNAIVTARLLANGSAGLIKTGAGTLTLSGSNTYTGVTTLGGGILSVATIGNGGVAGNLGQAGSAATNWVFDGGTLQYTGATASTDRNFTINNGKTAVFSVITNNLTLSGASTATTGGLTKTGNGTLTLSGVNAHTGTTAVSAGTLTISGAGTLGNVADLILGGGLLDLGGSSQTVGAVSITAAPASGNTIQNGNLTGTSYAASNTSGNAIVTARLLANGSAGLIKTGAGTLTLSGSNTYTGVTTLGDGLLSVATIGNGGVAGNLGQAGSAATNWVFDGGTLQYTGATAATDRNFTINNGKTAVFSVITTNLTLSGASTATTGGLTKTGNGTLTLSGVNAHTGTTSVNAGTLTISGAGTLGNGADLTLGGGLLDLGGSSQTVGAVSITAAAASGNTIQNGSLTGTSYAASNPGGNATVTANLLVNGSAGLTKTGAGSLILTGTNTYTGVTTLSDGTLSVATIGNGGVAGNFGQASNAAANLVFDGGTLQYTGATAVTDRSFTINNGKTAVIDVTTNSLTLAGGPTATTGALTKTGNGNLTLSGANSYAGTTTVNAGTLILTGTNSTGGAITLTAGTLQLGNASNGGLAGGLLTLTSGTIQSTDATARSISNALAIGGDITVAGTGNLSFTGTADSALTAVRTLTINNTSTSLASGFSGPGGLTKAGNGTLTLAGANSYAGLTTINAGTLIVTGSNSSNGATTLTAGTLQFGGVTNGGVAGGLLTLTSGTIQSTDGTARSIANALSIGGNLTVAGTGNLSFTGTVDSALTAIRTLTINNTNTTIYSAFGGAGGIFKSGNGTLTLAGIESYLGTTTVSAGTLIVTGNNTSIGATTLTAGTLQLGNASNGGLASGLLTLTAGTIQSNDSTARSVANALSIGGNITVGGTGDLSFTNSAATALGGNRTFAINNGNTSFASAFSGTSFGITKTGTGALTLAGANTYSGLTTVSAGTLIVTGNNSSNGGTTLTAGTLQLGNANNGGLASGTLTLTAGTIQSNDSTARSVANPLSIGGNITVAGSGDLAFTSAVSTALGGNRTFSIGNGNTSFAALFTGTNFGITKAGNGTLILSGTNSYTGLTTVSAGTLALSGAGTLGSGGNLTLAGGTLDLGTTSQNVGAVSITAAAAAGNTIQSGNLTGSSYSGNFTAGNAIVTANLLGSAALSKAGNGTLTLSGANSYSGTTTVTLGNLTLTGTNSSLTGATILNGGTLQLGNADNGGLARGILTFGGGTIQSNDTTTRTVVNDLAFTSNVAVAGTGDLVFSSTAGTALGATRTFTIGNTNTTFAAALSGTTFGITKAGAGTLTLSGINTYSGNTTVNAGTVALSGAGTPGNATVGVILGGGLLDLGATSQSVGAVTITAAAPAGNTIQNGNLTGSSYTGNLTSGNAIVTANLLGSAALTKSGNGTLTLAGVNTYTGTTSVNAGNLTISGAGTLGNMAALSMGGGLLILGGTSQVVGPVSITAAPATGNTIQGGDLTGTSYTANNTGNATVAANLLGSAALSKSGAGTLILSGTNTYSGLTSVSAGVLTLTGTNSSIGATTLTSGTLQLGTLANGGLASGVLTLGAGTLQSTDSTARTVANDLLLSGNATLGGTGNFTFTSTADSALTAVRTVTVNNTSTSMASAFSGAGGISKAGNGTLTLAGATSYAGGTTVTAGTLILSGNNSSSGVTTLTAGTLQLGTGSNGGMASGTLTLGGGTLQSTDSSARSIANALTIGSNVFVAGTGDITFANTGNFSLGGNRSFTIGNSNTTFASILSGTNFGIVKTGAGTLTLKGANTYTGNTSVTAGTFLLDRSAGGSLANTSPLVLGGGNFQIKGAAAGGTQLMGGFTLAANSSSSIVLDPNGGNLTLTLGNVWTRGAGSSLLIDYSSANSGTRTVATAGNTTTTTLTNGIYGWALVKDSAGVTGFATRTPGANNPITRFDDTTGTTLADTSNSAGVNFTTLASSYSGGNLTWTNGGLTTRSVNSLTIDTTNNFGTIDLGASTNVLTLTSGAILFKGANNETLTGGTIGASGSEVIIHQTGAGLLTINSPISGGAGSLTKDGTGRVVVAGTNSYTGNTTINGGTLQFASNAAFYGNTSNWIPSKISVASGAVLAFNVGGASELAAVNLAGLLDSTHLGNSTATTGLRSGSFLGLDTSSGNYTPSAAFTNTVVAGNVIGLQKLGSNTLNLNFANSYTGGTIIKGGTLALGNSSGTALADSGAVDVGNGAGGATLDLTTANETIGALTLNQGTVQSSGNRTLTTSSVTVTGSANTIASGTTVVGSATFGNGAALAVQGSLTGNATVGNGVLSGSGSLTGTTSVTSGTVSGSGLTLGGVVTFNGSGNVLSGNVTASGGVAVASGASLTKSGNLSGSVTTSGTVIVSGSISGNVDVATGGLFGGTGSVGGNITVAAGGTLAPGNSPGIMTGGNATINGTYTVDMEANAPGAGAATSLHGYNYDQTQLSGGLSLGGNSTLTLNPSGTFDPSGIAHAGHTYAPGDNPTLDNYFILTLGSGTTTGMFYRATVGLFTDVIDYSITNRFHGIAGIGTFKLNGQEYAISYYGDVASGSTYMVGGNDVVLTAIPEPGSLVSMVGGLGILIALQRRRRRR